MNTIHSVEAKEIGPLMRLMIDRVSNGFIVSLIRRAGYAENCIAKTFPEAMEIALAYYHAYGWEWEKDESSQE